MQVLFMDGDGSYKTLRFFARGARVKQIAWMDVGMAFMMSVRTRRRHSSLLLGLPLLQHAGRARSFVCVPSPGITTHRAARGARCSRRRPEGRRRRRVAGGPAEECLTTVGAGGTERREFPEIRRDALVVKRLRVRLCVGITVEAIDSSGVLSTEEE
jgi:hypothetical protein